jgi:hypothetical protein
MKYVFLVVAIVFFSLNSSAQYQAVKPHVEKESSGGGGFQKDHLFTGGNVQFSLSNYNFGVGGSPVIGYSINSWFDAGIGVNVNYVSVRETYDNGYELVPTGNKARQTVLAPLAFARVYPLKFLFAQAQFEQNFIAQKFTFASGGPSEKYKGNAPSLLVGAGYCGGREDFGDFFYYISLSVDVLRNKNSPYVQVVGNSVNFLPVLRVGIQIPLFQGKRG